jgi:transcription antitermination protein NusB
VSDAPAGASRWDERHRAREAALRALYQVAVGHVPVAAALDLVEHGGDEGEHITLDSASREFAERLVTGAWDTRDDLDAIIAPHSVNWRIERLATLDHLVMRMAVHEWVSEPKTPPRVVLSEALELARAYSGDAAVKFVNGVLDAVYRRLKQEGRIID